jgi:hypothetical protein
VLRGGLFYYRKTVIENNVSARAEMVGRQTGFYGCNRVADLENQQQKTFLK